MPEAKQNTSKLAEMFARASVFTALIGIAVDVVGLSMALLSFRGFDTPSLPAQGEQRRSSFFNIRRDIPPAVVLRLRDDLEKLLAGLAPFQVAAQPVINAADVNLAAGVRVQEMSVEVSTRCASLAWIPMSVFCESNGRQYR